MPFKDPPYAPEYVLGTADDDKYKVYHQRFRATLAEINAGTVLLAAIPGWAYRLVDVSLISIGGAFGGSDTVDITGTSSSSRKLLAAAIAALTENTLLRAGATNATILAAGASFTLNDANTTISISKTGATGTTATHVDVLLSYCIEKA